jgi:hypothetical protein
LKKTYLKNIKGKRIISRTRARRAHGKNRINLAGVVVVHSLRVLVYLSEMLFVGCDVYQSIR